LIELECSNINYYIIRHNNEIESRKLDYITNNNELKNIAFNVAELYWLILTQYSKLIAFKYGNRIISNVNIIDNINLNQESKKVLQEFDTNIEKEWNNYPNINTSLFNKMLNLWNKLCLCNGYLFKEGEKGDGLGW